MDVVIGRDLDLDDLFTTPDDGNRYEILDGAFVITPRRGQRISTLSHRWLCYLITLPASSA